jgi:hypothetical protein
MHSPAVRPMRVMRSCWSGMGAIAEPAVPSARAWLTRGATIVRVGAHIGISASLDRKMASVRYQTFRSFSDLHVFVICRDGTF